MLHDSMRVYVNERPLEMPPGADVRAAVRTADAALADAVEAGRARVSDGRGIDVALDAPLAAGSILRVVLSARRADADAHA
ncbi:MAG TPA: hypothetical protein VFW66_04035 [Gemmatimonadales bacterium]|nr:hypothetical protein [Gemmatimonadales bacterium]